MISHFPSISSRDSVLPTGLRRCCLLYIYPSGQVSGRRSAVPPSPYCFIDDLNHVQTSSNTI